MKMEMCLNNLMAYRNQPQTEGIQSKCPMGRMVPCYLIPVLLCLCSIHNKNCIPVTCPLILTKFYDHIRDFDCLWVLESESSGSAWIRDSSLLWDQLGFPNPGCVLVLDRSAYHKQAACCVRLTETWILSFGTLQYQSKCCQCGSHLQFLSPI